MVDVENITVELIYIEPNSQNLLTINIPKDNNVSQAIHLSGILKQFSEIDLSVNKVGVFNNIVSLDTKLSQGDRIEIYRSLLADPKEARRRRAGNK